MKHSKTRTAFVRYSTDGGMSNASGGWRITYVAAREPGQPYTVLTRVSAEYVR